MAYDLQMPTTAQNLLQLPAAVVIFLTKAYTAEQLPNCAVTVLGKNIFAVIPSLQKVFRHGAQTSEIHIKPNENA